MSQDDLGRTKSFRLAPMLEYIDPSNVNEKFISYLFRATVIILLAYLILPVFFAILLSFNEGGLGSFASSFTLEHYVTAFTSEMWITAYAQTFLYSIIATVIAMILSVSAAYPIGRYSFPYKNIFSASTYLPLMIPQIILGLALLLVFQEYGIISNLWEVSMALAVYSTPYAIQSIITSMQNLDRSLEEAAMNLGADELQTFKMVTFPLLLPGLATGAIFAFIISFINLQIIVFLQGPSLDPIPVLIFSQMSFGASPIIAAIATINIIIVVGAVILVDHLYDVAEALGYT
jgi:ABC-type spermidine/putrescine transport system permease subunit II